MDPPPTQEIDGIDTARGLIEASFVKPPSLATLAAAAGVNVFQLSRRFRRTFGKSIRVYVRQLRIAKAKELLEQTDERVGSIAKKVGYKSFSSFCRAYLLETGENPSLRRRSERENP